MSKMNLYENLSIQKEASSLLSSIYYKKMWS